MRGSLDDIVQKSLVKESLVQIRVASASGHLLVL